MAGLEVLQPEIGVGIGKWIRPVSSRPTTELSLAECCYENQQTPKLLDILHVPLLWTVPKLHQTENYLIDVSRPWVKVGEFPRDKVSLLCDQPQALWTNNFSTCLGNYDCVCREEACGERHSLVLIRPEDFTVHIGYSLVREKRCYRGNFTYNDKYYSLSLTDPLARGAFGAHDEGDYRVRDAYLCVSLTKPYTEDDRCHKLVAAIIGPQPFAEVRPWKTPYTRLATPRTR